jgi:multidrug efflux pump subunit AcrB
MERANGQGELRRENLRPMAVVSGRLEGSDLGSAVADIQSKLDALKLPIGYTYEIGGQYQAQGQAFRELLMVFALAILLVFVILVTQFRAWIPAMLILLAAPLSLSGALLLLWLTGIDLNISSAMGLILLVGLGREKRHHAARLLRDAARRRRVVRGRHRARRPHSSASDSHDHLLHAVRAAPLALGLGAGAELQKPLALAVIGGLTLSTPVTLLAVPGLYAAIKRWQ